MSPTQYPPDEADFSEEWKTDLTSPALVDDEKLVERLNALFEEMDIDACKEASSRIQSLSAEVTRLREALWDCLLYGVENGDWVDKQARAALSPPLETHSPKP